MFEAVQSEYERIFEMNIQTITVFHHFIRNIRARLLFFPVILVVQTNYYFEPEPIGLFNDHSSTLIILFGRFHQNKSIEAVET